MIKETIIDLPIEPNYRREPINQPVTTIAFVPGLDWEGVQTLASDICLAGWVSDVDMIGEIELVDIGFGNEGWVSLCPKH